MPALLVVTGLLAGAPPLVAEPLEAHPPSTALERQLAAVVTNLYAGVAHEDPDVRREALRAVMPSRADMVRLLGADVELVWPEVEERVAGLLADPPRMGGRSRQQGNIDNILTTIAIADLRANRRYAKLAELIPEDIPACKVVTHFADGEADAISGPYLFMRGRWIWLSGGDNLPRAVRKLRAEAERRRAATDQDR